MSQLKIWHFWVNGIERNVWNCTFNRYSVITQFVKLAAGEQFFFRRCTHGKVQHLKDFKGVSEKSLILSCDTVVANVGYDHFMFALYKAYFRHDVHKSILLDFILSHWSVLRVLLIIMYYSLTCTDFYVYKDMKEDRF